MSFSDKLGHDKNLSNGIIEAAAALGVDPVDLATIISYETAGTFDPQKKGPKTKWGQHAGFIQFGEPQQEENGADLSTYESAMKSQLGAGGAIVNYFRRNGFKNGMGLLDMYSIVNTGGPGNYDATDEASGGMPGTVRDKVNDQMSGHRAKAIALLGNGTDPTIPLGNPHFNNGFGSAILTAKASDTNSKSTEIVSNEANDKPDSLNADVSTAMAKMVNMKATENKANKASMTSMRESSSDNTDDNEVVSYSAYMMQNNPYQDSRRVLVNSPEIQSQSVADERLSTPFNSGGMRFSLAFDV